MGGVISVLRIFSKRLLKMLVLFASLALIGGTTALVLPDVLTQEFVAKNQTTVEDLIQFEADRLNDPLDPLGDLLSKGGNPLNPGPYTFGFISGDSAHTETRKADGTVEGRYIFVNQEGKVKQVAYVSNSSGFYPLNEADPDFSFLPSSAPSATSVLPLHEALLPEINPTSLPPTFRRAPWPLLRRYPRSLRPRPPKQPQPLLQKAPLIHLLLQKSILSHSLPPKKPLLPLLLSLRCLPPLVSVGTLSETPRTWSEPRSCTRRQWREPDGTTQRECTPLQTRPKCGVRRNSMRAACTLSETQKTSEGPSRNISTPNCSTNKRS